MVEEGASPPYGVTPRCCLVLDSEDPQHLAGFYIGLFSGEPRPVVPEGAITIHLPMGMDMVFYRRSHQGLQPQQSRGLALCLRCVNLDCIRQRATDLGARMLEPIHEKSFGREQWLLDPEGNRVLLWEDPTDPMVHPA